MCSRGYGRSLSITCHACNGTMARLLIVACTVFFVLTPLLLSLALVYLIGGRDVVNATRQSVARTLSSLRKASNTRKPAREKTSPQRNYSGKGPNMHLTNRTIGPMLVTISASKYGGGEDNTDNSVDSTFRRSELDEPEITYAWSLDVVAGVGTGVGESSTTNRRT